jgi:hypothetical protein
MTPYTFTMEVLNISMHLNGVDSRAPFISVINGTALVVCDSLGEFRGEPQEVLTQMVAAAKVKSAKPANCK